MQRTVLAAWAECGRSRRAEAADALRCRLQVRRLSSSGRRAALMQLAIAAKFVECSEPAAERSCVLIPACARIVFEKLRGVVAEQMVRVHGERGQAIARAGELHGFGRGVRHNASPQRLLLERTQHHAAVRSLSPTCSSHAPRTKLCQSRMLGVGHAVSPSARRAR